MTRYKTFVDAEDELGASEKIREEIREDVLEAMSSTKFDVDTVRQELEDSKFSAGTAHYALLCKKRDRDGPGGQKGGSQQKKMDPTGAPANAAKFRISDDGQLGRRSFCFCPPFL